ncbi:hypothetical protein KP509_13G016300 [Ceratopteris richardii]|uniref:MPN domain-containing protein n=1 Tax=Ceratopteris richardii TaxID=49495 RepID=A0A8T2TDZ8_CERRI|nr:hypothetical protein KP509_13G016300 [Ceratopteris richardii]
MVGKYEIGAKAYLKAVLHAAKYKTCAVNGLLIGRVKGDGLDNFSLQILECVPLFHNHLALLPMLEVALLQVEEHFSTVDGGLQIVGYYHANERFDDFELNAVARKIGDHIIRYCPQAVILMLDHKQLAALPKSGSRKPVMQLYMRDVSRVWKQGGTTAELVFQDTTTNNLLEAYMADGRQRLVVDFDEHLDDISKDWMNRALFD